MINLEIALLDNQEVNIDKEVDIWLKNFNEAISKKQNKALVINNLNDLFF